MTLAFALCAMPRATPPPPEPPPSDPWFIKYFPAVVRWSGLGVSMYLMVSGKVEPQIALAFAGTMISGTLLAEAIAGRKK